MLLPPFEYHRPASLTQALELLGELGESARPLAGGTDLLVNLKLKKLAPSALVDLSGLSELRGGWRDDGKLTLGALNTASGLAAGGPEIPRLLALGASVLGSPQVRHRATLGGNLVTARPAADICLPLLALGAVAVLAGPQGEREVPLDGYFLGPGQTVKQPGEVLTQVRLDAPRPGTGGGYQKLGLRQAMEIALVNVAAHLELAEDGSVARARVALGAVAPTPMLSPGAAAALEGAEAGPESLAAAAQAAAADAKPIDDHRGSADYRRDMVRNLTLRALEQALAPGQGDTGMNKLAITLTVNGVERQALVEPNQTLTSLLRDELGLTGTKHGCGGVGDCGCCTVILDNETVNSCLVLAVQAQGREVADHRGAGPRRRAAPLAAVIRGRRGHPVRPSAPRA